MNAMMGTFFGWLARASWQAAVLVVMVALVQLLFRKKLGASWRYALWLLVVARLLLRVSPHSAVSLFNFAPAESTHAKPEPVIAAAETLPIAPGAIAAEQASAAEPGGAPTATQAPGREEHHETSPAELKKATAPERSVRSLPWREALATIGAVIWGLGAGLLALRVLAQNLAFAHRLRGARAVTDAGTLALFEQCKASLGVGQPVGLVETGEVKSPALHGFFRPCLLLPARMIGEFSQKELRYIFLHELAHVKRRDMAVHWAATVLGVLHWFNPVL